MTALDKYTFNAAWSGEDAGYIATCPEFPDLSAFGATLEDSIAELRVALRLAIKTYKKEGWPIPAARGVSQYSGQFRLRLPKSLHQSLSVRAEAEGVSLNTLAVMLLSSGISQRPTADSRGSSRSARIVSS